MCFVVCGQKKDVLDRTLALAGGARETGVNAGINLILFTVAFWPSPNPSSGVELGLPDLVDKFDNGLL